MRLLEKKKKRSRAYIAVEIFITRRSFYYLLKIIVQLFAQYSTKKKQIFNLCRLKYNDVVESVHSVTESQTFYIVLRINGEQTI